MLPTINACLNALATVLLVIGYIFIKRKNVDAHRRCMIAAFCVSCVFLVFYVVDKILKHGVHTPFNHGGVVRYAYYTMLITHVILAMTVPVFAIVLIRLALKGRFEAHRKLAKIGYPVWLYVSVTGVLIYFALYVF
ncbi:MAG: DUF420 domain-containing protein [Phycisphaera sp.]|nr:DUF420 domain-containing protein [Phycisphaera sp.]